MSTEHLGNRAPQQPLHHPLLALHIETNSRDSLRKRVNHWLPAMISMALAVGLSVALAMLR